MFNPPDSLAIAVAQPVVVPGDIQANLRSMRPLVVEAARRGADLVLFSECGITGYDLRGAAMAAAIKINDPALDAVSKMAVDNRVAVVTGFYERRDSLLYNTAVAFLPDGTRRVQRKHSIIGYERRTKAVTKAPRDRVLFKVRGVKLAILICADVGAAHLIKDLAKGGCDALLVITAGLGSAQKGFHQAALRKRPERKRYLAAAESVCFLGRVIDRCLRRDMGFACCNQLGWQDATGYFQPGHSAVIDRTGEVTALIPGRFVLEHVRPDLAVGFVSPRKAERD